MQQIKCSRSLLTCWPPAARSFASASSIMYRNDFKSNPTSLVMDPLQGKSFVQGYNQRKREYGMRTLTYTNKYGGDALNHLNKILNSDQISEQPILYDGSTKEKVCIDVLKTKNLLLLFSKLKIPCSVIDFLKPVHEKLQEQKQKKDVDVIVWIPVEYKQWDQKTFEDYSQKMPWYTIKCFPSSKYIMEHELFLFKGKPMLTVMNKRGEVEETDALPLIQKMGVDAFLNAYIYKNSK